jgi:hypothetical protein
MASLADFLVQARALCRERRVDRRQQLIRTELIEAQFGALVRSVYSQLSGSVHTGAEKKEILSIKRFVETVLIELLEIGA